MIKRNKTLFFCRVYKPPLVGIKENSLRARVPQKLIDDSVIHTEDDKYMVYKVMSLLECLGQGKNPKLLVSSYFNIYG